ncbi:MAG TPA: di-heme oxidoredictase family protein [Pyrinomonadaceae bacterium]|jgi:Tol biopolymer transport system component|nr:di-heme oxidoredictase family protein [Pyrinomonadaceae bacterium]
MRSLKILVVAFFAAALAYTFTPTRIAKSQGGATEAPAVFDNQTNGFTTQAQFDSDRAAFEAREERADGLGPVYNAQACVECHQNRVTGGSSQVMELRAGHTGPDGSFVNPPGGSLIQSRSVGWRIQERVPDGPRIAYRDDAKTLHVMGLDGGQFGAIGNTTQTGGYPSFSPDGTKLTFNSNANNLRNILTMNSDGTGVQQLTATNVDQGPAWSIDGTKIAFHSQRTGVWQIFTMNATNGANVANISNSPATDDTFAAWSPDGTKIAFSRRLPGISPQVNIWVMNADGTGQVAITSGIVVDERPTWSPDGAWIAFHSNRDGNWEIYKVPSAPGISIIPPTRLTNNPAWDANPAWAPDDSAIAFTSLRSGANHIWTIETDGSRPSQVTGSTTGDQAAYSKDQGETIRTFRASPHVLGAGFVEATDDNTFRAIRAAQPPLMRGTAIDVPLLEAPGQTRLGRFGWKDSVASLLSFSAGAYLLEMGITSPLQPNESTSLGRNVMAFDLTPDPEDTGGPMGFGEDVEAFARFMRSTKAPPRDRETVPDDTTDPGSALFDSLSCSVCHVRQITTAPPGTVFNGGTFVVDTTLGNKTYRPFSDFLLHDVGTGDGIAEAGGEPTRNMMRTAPLWGLRTRDKFMHDGGSSSPPTNSGAQSFTLNEVVLRHGGQATASRTAYQALTAHQKAQLIRFLKSL